MSEEDKTEIFLKIVIASKSLDLDILLSCLSVEPTRAFRLGEPKKNSIPANRHSCSLWTRNMVTSTKLDTHWDWLFEKINSDRFHVLQNGECELQLDICGYLYDRPYLGFSNESLMEISTFGFEMVWDVYDFRE